MKGHRGLHIGEGFFIRVTFPDDDAFQAKGVGDIPIRMFLNDDFTCVTVAASAVNPSDVVLLSYSADRTWCRDWRI